MNRRRQMVGAMALLLASSFRPVQALTAERLTLPNPGMLDREQSECFRAWMSLIVSDQIRRGPSPRWFHRDCAGLARFAVAEAFRAHDLRWRRASGFDGRHVPPDIELRPDQTSIQEGWNTLEGKRGAFVTALALIQNNSRSLGRESNLARPGDLLFFDQGDDQHLMIWMGSWIAYHTGQTPRATPPRQAAGKRSDSSTTPEDNGLRAITPAQLLQWKDTRWRPRDDNPNFAGFYRLAFLSH